MNEHDNNEELQCRICAEFIEDNNSRINIFEEDARRIYLQMKIRKYLYVLVSSDDRLPQIVCFTCIKRLEGIHRFAMKAHKAQERLKIKFYKSSDDESKEEYENDDEDNDQGLLRSILINKDGQDIENMISSSPLDKPIHSVMNSVDNDVTVNTMVEMEVKVDPMIFLQCDLDRSPSIEAFDSNSADDEKYDYQIKNTQNFILEDNTTKRKNQRSSPIKTIDDHDNPDESINSVSYDCNICSRSFRTQTILQNHLWLHLPRADRYDNDNIDNSTSFNGSGTFVCPICNKKISTKGNLKVHLETHRPKGKYGCDNCGRIFKTQSNLFRHKEYHSGIQFPCSVCGRVYPTNSTLRAHSITHSDLRPHACPLCDKTFKRNQDLKFHINQHTGARPYQCPYCPKAFASSGNCFSHRKRMHPKEVHRDRQRAADLMR